MEETRYVRLRTTIVVVSMLVLPAAAVFGVKMPAESLASKSSGTAPNTVSEKPSAEQSAPTAGRPEHRGSSRNRMRPSGRRQGRARSSKPATEALIRLCRRTERCSPRPRRTSMFPADRRKPRTPPHRNRRSHWALPHRSVRRRLPRRHSTTARLWLMPRSCIRPPRPPPHPRRTEAGLEQFTQIQQRLRALGRTHYALENLGHRRATVSLPMPHRQPDTADYTRQFEATDTEALRTMLTVLEEVEAWKAGRLP